MITFLGDSEELASGTLETGFPLFSGRKIMLKKKQEERQKYNHCLVNIYERRKMCSQHGRDNF